MRSLFVREPFGQHGVGTPVMGWSLAQAPEAAFAIQDYLARIQGLADEETRKELKAKYDECQAETDSAKQLVCFGQLAARIATAIEREPKPGAAAPVPAPRPTPPPSEFPVWPLAIGGLAVAGLVVYLATRG